MQNNIKQQAFQHFNAGRMKKARILYEKYVKQNPRDPEALYMLGAIFGQTGNFSRASDYFSKTLKLQPDAFVALCGLGAAEKQLGNIEKAKTVFEKALKLQPSNTDILLELAGILVHQSNLDDAKTLLRNILESNPECADAAHGLGDIYHIRRELDTAALYYKQALSSDNQRASTHNQLGCILRTKGLYKEAIEHFKSAITIQPDFIEAYKNLGQSHTMIGEFNEALLALDKAIKNKPDYIDAIACMAEAYEKQGELEKAYGIIKPHLKKSDKNTGIGHVFASICKKLDKCDEAITYINQLLEQKLDDKARESLHFALGGVFNKLSHYNEAFKHYEMANDLRPDDFRPAVYRSQMEAFKQIFNWQYMQSAARASYQTETPVFIVGMPRSGTSLTEQILDSHPEISGVGELLEIENYAKEISVRLNPNITFPLALENIPTELLDIFAKQYEERLRTGGNKARFITDKMPQNYIFLGLISLMFPKAKIIHCIRNPLDICLSIYFQSFNESHTYASNLKNIANYYLEYRRLMEHWKNIPNLSIHDVHYEDLVREPENTVRDLLAFLDVDWDPACLSFYESKRHIATASYDQVRSKLYTSSINRWKNYEGHLDPLLEVLSPHIPDLMNNE